MPRLLKVVLLNWQCTFPGSRPNVAMRGGCDMFSNCQFYCGRRQAAAPERSGVHYGRWSQDVHIQLKSPPSIPNVG